MTDATPAMDPRLLADPTLPEAPVPAPEKPVQDHLLSNKLYDVIKLLAQIILPAVGTLYFTLSGIWGLPQAEKVIGSITALDVFLGVLLTLSSTSFDNSNAKYDGAIAISSTPSGKKTYSLELNTDPSALDSKDQVLFAVKPFESS